jgi:hypothetical protein
MANECPVADVPDIDEPETWVFQIALSIYDPELDIPSMSKQERMRVYKEYGLKYCEPFRSAVEWTPEDHAISSDRASFLD